MQKASRVGKLGWVLLWAVVLTGCSRQDTERLGKIGNIVNQRVELVIGDAEDDFLRRWQQTREQRQQHQLARQITQRIERDQRLSSCKIDVVVEGDDLVLRGQVKNGQQRQTLVELAASIAGAGKIKDRLKSADENP
jgi:osmotically-inducible protein OsmY